MYPERNTDDTYTLDRWTRVVYRVQGQRTPVSAGLTGGQRSPARLVYVPALAGAMAGSTHAVAVTSGRWPAVTQSRLAGVGERGRVCVEGGLESGRGGWRPDWRGEDG